MKQRTTKKKRMTVFDRQVCRGYLQESRIQLRFYEKRTEIKRRILGTIWGQLSTSTFLALLFIHLLSAVDTCLQIKHKCVLILLDIIFHALMGRFQLELFIFIAYFSTVAPLTSRVFFPVGLSTGLVVSSVSCQLPKPGDRRNYKT